MLFIFQHCWFWFGIVFLLVLLDYHFSSQNTLKSIFSLLSTAPVEIIFRPKKLLLFLSLSSILYICMVYACISPPRTSLFDLMLSQFSFLLILSVRKSSKYTERILWKLFCSEPSMLHGYLWMPLCVHVSVCSLLDQFCGQM